MDETFKAMENFYFGTFKIKEFFDFNDENMEKMNQLLKEGVIVPLSERNSEGEKIILFRLGRRDTEKFSIYDISRLTFYTSSVLLNEEETQIAGISVVVDLAGLTAAHLGSPMFVKDFVNASKSVSSIRFKTSYFINLPPFAKFFVDLFVDQLSEKIGMRFKALDNPAELQNFIDKSSLLEEYGGEATFEETMQKYLVIEKKKRDRILREWRFSKSWDKNALNLIESAEDDEGVGSFRKLEID
jgi:hypothetical protein